MTGAGTKTFTEEFKREAVRLVQTSGRTVGEVAADLGIGKSTLGKWLTRHREADLLSDPHDDMAKGLARLRKENEILKAERDLLKKAAAFFATALARELVHAAVGIRAGKGSLYRKVALGIGLTGPVRNPNPGSAFLALAAPILEAVARLPHARLLADRKPDTGPEAAEDAPLTTRPRQQASGHVKCVCPACGYLVLTTRKWLDQAGPPLCPQHGPMAISVDGNGEKNSAFPRRCLDDERTRRGRERAGFLPC